jgi:hypothetical protein
VNRPKFTRPFPPKLRHLWDRPVLSETERRELWRWIREQIAAGIYSRQQIRLIIAADLENQLCQDAEAAAKPTPRRPVDRAS